jgi:hypothetical protein
MNNRRNGLPETGISYAAAVAKIIRPNPCRCSPAQVSACSIRASKLLERQNLAALLHLWTLYLAYKLNG